jgi:ATP-dependent protease ClpP protease subunit
MNHAKNDETYNDNNNNNEQPLFPFLPNREQIRSFKRTIPVAVYDFYITDEIKEPDVYMELIQTLKSADPQDTIFIYLNTPGGSLYTTIQIMSAITSSQAKVITCLEGQACSAGTFIFLAGDTKIVNPHCTFMVHNYSQGASGKGNEIVSHVNYMDRYFKRLAEDVYTEFLTKTELESVIKGDDMWMDSHELVKRLDANNHDYIYTGQDLDEILGRDPDEISDEMEDASKPKQRAKKKVTKKKASRKKTASD